MKAIEQVILQMDTFSLNELVATAPLLNRFDRKYIMPLSNLPALLQKLQPDYSVLEIEGTRMFRYATHYYDTPEKKYFFNHHRGLAKRYKVRKRIYTDSGMCFMEIKHKMAKGNTFKCRKQIQQKEDAGNENCIDFLTANGVEEAKVLEHSVNIFYNRITLLHKDKQEKITFDINMSCANGRHAASFNNLVVIEQKIPSFSYRRFLPSFEAYDLKLLSISKYCLAVITLNPLIKHNAFKMQLRHIHKINNLHNDSLV